MTLKGGFCATLFSFYSSGQGRQIPSSSIPQGHSGSSLAERTIEVTTSKSRRLSKTRFFFIFFSFVMMTFLNTHHWVGTDLYYNSHKKTPILNHFFSSQDGVSVFVQHRQTIFFPPLFQERFQEPDWVSRPHQEPQK